MLNLVIGIINLLSQIRAENTNAGKERGRNC